MSAIAITVRWKQSGGGREFRRPDLIARALRKQLPKVLFRIDVDEILRREGTDLAAGTVNDKPAGWDDYYLVLDYDITHP